MFPNDVAERDHNVVHWAEFTRGGHFAALEAPDLLTGDVLVALEGEPTPVVSFTGSWTRPQATGMCSWSLAPKICLLVAREPLTSDGAVRARLAGLEPATGCLEGSCSIQLSYRRPGQFCRVQVTRRPHRSAEFADCGAPAARWADTGGTSAGYTA